MSFFCRLYRGFNPGTDFWIDTDLCLSKDEVFQTKKNIPANAFALALSQELSSYGAC